MNQLTTFATLPAAEARLGQGGQDRLPHRGEALAGEGLDLEGAGGVAHAERHLADVAPERLGSRPGQGVFFDH